MSSVQDCYPGGMIQWRNAVTDTVGCFGYNRQQREDEIAGMGNYLTAREKEILLLICKQYTTAAIAFMLSISLCTVDKHRNNLLLKTDVKNMIGLLVYALVKKMLDIDDLAFDLVCKY